MRVYACVYKYEMRRKKRNTLQVWNQVFTTMACVSVCVCVYTHSMYIYIHYKLVCGFSRQEQQTVLTGWFFFRATACQTSNPMNACRSFEWKSTQGGLFTLLVSSIFFSVFIIIILFENHCSRVRKILSSLFLLVKLEGFLEININFLPFDARTI